MPSLKVREGGPYPRSWEAAWTEADERFLRPPDGAAAAGGLLRDRLSSSSTPWGSLFTVVFCKTPPHPVTLHLRAHAHAKKHAHATMGTPIVTSGRQISTHAPRRRIRARTHVVGARNPALQRVGGAGRLGPYH